MYNVTTEITVELRGQEFEIDIWAEVDRDRVPDNIELYWQNPETSRSKELPRRIKDFVEEKFNDAIHTAICEAPLDNSDCDYRYDLWKESF